MQTFRDWENPNVESAVKIAINNRNIEIVRYFLDTDPTLDVNNMSSGERGSNSTPLTLAIDHGAEDIVNLLLACGADVNKSSAYGHSPLSCAAKEGLVSIVQRLLYEGADPTHFHPEREPSLMKGAVLARSLPIMKLLLDHGAKVDAVDTFDLYEFRGTPLDVAVMENLFEEAELLVKESHADVNFTWGNNKTQVICHAAGRGSVKKMALLLGHGADVNGGDADYSPLYNAASSRHLAAPEMSQGAIKVLIVSSLPNRQA